MKKLSRLTLDVSNSTPWMVKGGADQNKPGELSPKALRGLMRYWFRALYYGSSGLFEGGYPIEGDLQKLKKLEDVVFGGTENRGIFNLQVIPKVHSGDVWKGYQPLRIKKNRKGKPEQDIGLYMAYHKAHEELPAITNGLNRKYRWEIQLTFLPYETKAKKLLGSSYSRELLLEYTLNALAALFVFGGVGGRSRRGMGSLRIENSQSNHVELPASLQPNMSLETLKEECRRLAGFGAAYSDLPQITAFSKHSRLSVLDYGLNSFNVMENASDILKQARSKKVDSPNQAKFGGGHIKGLLKDGLMRNEPLMREGRSKEAVENFFKKYMLGLSLHFVQPPNEKTGEGEVRFASEGSSDRRASPLFISQVVLREQNQTVFTALGLYLPAVFGPESQMLFSYKGSRDRIALYTQTFEHSFEIEHKYVQSLLNRGETVSLQRGV